MEGTLASLFHFKRKFVPLELVIISGGVQVCLQFYMIEMVIERNLPQKTNV